MKKHKKYCENKCQICTSKQKKLNLLLLNRKEQKYKKIMKCKCNERKQIFPWCTGFRPIMQKYNLLQNFYI